MMETAQTDVISRAASGDAGAMAELYTQYFDGVYDFLARMLRNQQDAEDAAQDTFVKAFRGLPGLEQPERFKSWLFSIAHNTAMTQLRRKGREVPFPDDSRGGGDGDGGSGIFDVADADRLTQPEQALGIAATAQLVWEAAAGLEERQYAVLDLNVRQGLESPEIAEAIGVTRNHAAVLLNRAKASLRSSTSALFLLREGSGRCEQLRHEVGASHGGTLTPDLAAAIGRHSRSCITCQSTQAGLMTPEVVFGALAPVVAAGAFKAGVWATVAGGIGLAAGTGAIAGAGAGAAAGAAAGGAGAAGGGAGGGVLGTAGIVGGGAVAVAAAVAGILFALGFFDDEAAPPAVPEPTPTVQAAIPPRPTSTPTARPTVTPTPSPTPTVTPSPTPQPAAALPARIGVSALGVDAVVTRKGLKDGGTAMENPDGPDDVAWYSFTAQPGSPGNAVLSGHYDYFGRGPAVFYGLNTLRTGDEFILTLEDGRVLTYEVVSSTSYSVWTIPMDTVLALGSTEETVTLITCSGAFSGTAYEERLVVVGRRVG
ncbi:MAG: sigma-70 family RNA polymerase sigma factor [Dehalococcoidia bacterium]